MIGKKNKANGKKNKNKRAHPPQLGIDSEPNKAKITFRLGAKKKIITVGGGCGQGHWSA